MTEDLVRRCRAALEAKRVELERRVGKLDRIAIERASDAVDEVQLAAERDLAIATLDRDAMVLRQVRSALESIDGDTFGLCLRCGDDIRPARLSAVPWASFCIRCQEEVDLEREAGAYHGRFDQFGEAA